MKKNKPNNTHTPYSNRDLNRDVQLNSKMECLGRVHVSMCLFIVYWDLCVQIMDGTRTQHVIACEQNVARGGNMW